MESNARSWQDVKRMSFFAAAKIMSIENAMI